MVRIRKSAWSLGTNSPELDWYGKAVAEMRKRPFSDPTSWAYQGGIHGYNQNTNPWPSLVSPPQPGKPGWELCQHQTWFFIPWHRGYITAFEAIVAQIVKDLGGPAEWALPYWNYSDGTPNARKIPPQFLGRNKPSGAPNPLWSQRRPEFDSNPNTKIPAGIVDPGPALAKSTFTSPGMGVPANFGGPATDFMHFGGSAGFSSGALEQQPHNLVHSAVGGWMGNPNTAGLDPLFWLHHANIDRLWEVWMRRWGRNANPSQTRWRSQTQFTLFKSKTATYSFFAKDVIDPALVLHGYRYDDQPAAGLEGVESMEESVEMPAEEGRPAELIGASDTGITLGSGGASAKVTIAGSTLGEEGLESVGPPPRVYLNIENVSGLRSGAIYRVLVRPPGGGEPVHAGYVSAFETIGRGEGVETAGGASSAFDVTEALQGSGEESAAPGELEVIFEEELPPSDDDSGLEGMAEPPRVGRVSLYRE